MEDRALQMLACDYDGTLAEEGEILPPTLDALRDAKRSRFWWALARRGE